MRRFSDSNFIGTEAEDHPIISRSRIVLFMLSQLSLWAGVLSTHCLTHQIQIQNFWHIFSLYLVMCTRAMDTYWLQPGLSNQSLLAESIWGLFIICLTLFPHYMNKNVLMSVGMGGSCGRNIVGRPYLTISMVQNIPQGTSVSTHVVIWEDIGLLKSPLLIFKRACFRKHWSNEEGVRFKISCHINSSLFLRRLSPLRYGNVVASFRTGEHRRDSRWQRRCLLHRNPQFHWEQQPQQPISQEHRGEVKLSFSLLNSLISEIRMFPIALLCSLLWQYCNSSHRWLAFL